MKTHRVQHSSLHYFSLHSSRRALSWALLSAFATINLLWYLTTDPWTIYSESRAAVLNSELARAAETHCSELKYRNKNCDTSKGHWVHDLTRAPLYTNETCKYIYPNQNCMKNGRPDKDYMYWRWKPNDCDLPSFNSTIFLQLMRGKKLLFVGDSIARNHMESLLCALSQVEAPKELGAFDGLDSCWKFASFDFTLALAWSPFLVAHTVDKDDWKLYLDQPEKLWTRLLDNYDVAVFSTTYWFFRKSTYYVDNKAISTFDPANSTSSEFLHGMQLVWRSVLRHLIKNYRGIAVVRTVSASHFEGDAWDKGGVCRRTQPYEDHEDGKLELDWTRAEIRKVQTQEFNDAQLALKRSTQPYPTLRLLDITYSTFLRPDGHPSTYRIQSSTEPRNDCVHWCMPGPIDAWNELILSDPNIVCLGNDMYTL